MLYLLILLLFASLVLAFHIQTGWAFSLPGMMMLVLIFWLLFGT